MQNLFAIIDFALMYLTFEDLQGKMYIDKMYYASRKYVLDFNLRTISVHMQICENRLNGKLLHLLRVPLHTCVHSNFNSITSL